MAELCRRFTISRECGYKWLGRWKESGGDPDSLRDLPRAPREHPNRLSPETERAVLALRREKPSWGPKKLRACLARQGAGWPLPAASTIGDLLSREGLTVSRERRRRATPTPPAGLALPEAPHDVAAIDFKGWWRTGDGRRFGPLTLSDLATRYVLRAVALGRDDEAGVRAVLEAAWREWGLPRVVRSDNGPPFASTGLGGLSKLSVWMMRLGIRPERIEPGCPAQNGCHERMHLTMAKELEARPAADRKAQQRLVERWRREFNEERPHEALAMRTPAELFGPSPRAWSEGERLLRGEPEYPASFEVRRVEAGGQVRWLGARFYTTRALEGELVGLRQDDERHWTLFFLGQALARLDGWHAELEPLRAKKKPSAETRPRQRQPPPPPTPPAVEM